MHKRAGLGRFEINALIDFIIDKQKQSRFKPIPFFVARQVGRAAQRKPNVRRQLALFANLIFFALKCGCPRCDQCDLHDIHATTIRLQQSAPDAFDVPT